MEKPDEANLREVELANTVTAFSELYYATRTDDVPEELEVARFLRSERPYDVMVVGYPFRPRRVDGCFVWILLRRELLVSKESLGIIGRRSGTIAAAEYQGGKSDGCLYL
jgi:hypothetical protein